MKFLKLLIAVLMLVLVHMYPTKTVIAQTVPESFGFRFPLDNYTPNDGCLEWQGTNSSFPGTYHAADDECSPEGTDVFASAKGLVRYARAHGTCPNWGHLIVIESQNPGGNVCAIYGHVIPTVSEGATVEQGQKIGDIGHYSCWSDHIHFGIHIGGYGVPTGEYPTWLAGYVPVEVWPNGYVNPVQFVQEYPALVGYYADGWHADGTSQAFLNSYLNNGGSALGTPYDRGEGVYVHQRTITFGSQSLTAWVQDFRSTNGHLWQLVLNPNDDKVYVIHGKILSWWRIHGMEVGYPMDNEVYGNYAGGALDNQGLGIVGHMGDVLTIQRFSYIETGSSFPSHTICYNGTTDQLGHYPVGKFQEDSPQNTQWYFQRTDSEIYMQWPKIGVVAPTGEWWTDTGHYTFFWIDGGGTHRDAVAHEIQEGNDQYGDPGDPGVTPPVLALGTVQSTSIGLSWTDASNPQGTTYTVYDAMTGDAISSGISAMQYTVSGLQESVPYSFQVTAVYSGDESSRSNTVSATTSGGSGTPPSGPMSLDGPNGGEVIPIGQYLTASWSGISVSDAVTLELSKDGGQNWTMVNTYSGGYALIEMTAPGSQLCLVRITHLQSPYEVDVSNGFFIVGEANTPPTAQSFPDTVVYRNALVIDVSSKVTDTDGTVNWNTLSVTSSLNGNSVVNAGAHTITFTSAFLFFGSTTVKYTVQDNDGAVSNEATISLFVKVVTSVIDNGDFQTQSLPPWFQESSDPSDAYVQWGSKPFQGQGSTNSYYLFVYVPPVDQGFGQDSVTVLQSGLHFEAGSHTITFDASRFSRDVPVLFQLFNHDRSTLIWSADTVVSNSSYYWKHYSVSMNLATPVVETVLKIKIGPASNIGAFFKIDDIALDGVLAKMAAGDMAEQQALVPTSYALHQNYPNPFNPTTTFRFDLPEASQVTLTVYDIAGRQVAVVADGVRTAGVYSIVWDASGLSSCVYFYRLEAGDRFRMTRKMLLMK